MRQVYTILQIFQQILHIPLSLGKGCQVAPGGVWEIPFPWVPKNVPHFSRDRGENFVFWNNSIFGGASVCDNITRRSRGIVEVTKFDDKIKKKVKIKVKGVSNFYRYDEHRPHQSLGGKVPAQF